MQVLITQPRGKEKLVQAFKDAGAVVVDEFTSDTNLIIPTVDEELWFFSRAKERLNFHLTKVMVSGQYAVDVCRDKYLFYKFCRYHGFQVPLTAQFEAIVKPRVGKASKGISVIDRSYLVQELSHDPEVSIDYFADWEGNCLSMIPRYRKNVVNGESKDYELVKDCDLTEVKRLGEELGLVGHAVIQAFYDGKEFTFSEVNPRFGGGSWMTFKYFDSPKWLMENL